MSLIPFILELADELHEFNRCLATGGMDVDDFGFGIYPHELQTQQQQQHQQTQHPLQQQQPQQQHFSQQRRPRALSQFYWLSNISKSRHHPYYRGKPCCNKTPIQLVHDHHLEKESCSTAGGGGGVIGTTSTSGSPAGYKESTSNTHTVNSSSPNVSTATAASKSAYSVVNKNGFQVSMNVKQFAPNELTVKTIDNCIVVEGQHEDKEDGHGVISRHFIRKYMLPKGYDPNEVLSTLSSDGILTVKAPPPAMKTDESLERIVDIQQTGGPMQVQSTAKEPSSAISSGNEDQANAATSAAEQAVTPVVVASGILPTSATVTLQQQQQQQQQQKQKQQPQQLGAIAECVQQQQPAKVPQPIVTELQVTRERNGNSEPNELVVEQETEPRRTAEQTTMSSNSNLANNNNNNNSIDTTNINSSGVKASTSSKANSKTEGKEKDSSSAEVQEEEKEKEKAAVNDSVNTKMTHQGTSNDVVTSAEIDAIMAVAVADELMQMETEEEEAVKEVDKKATVEDSSQALDIAVAIPIVSDVNSVANSSTSTNNNTTATKFIASNDSLNIVETNGIEITPSNDVDIELAGTTIAEASDIVVVTNNGISDAKTAADDLTISLETSVIDIDGATDMETDVAEVADVADGDMDADADGIHGDGIAVGGGDIGVGVDVNVISGDGSRASAEDGNEESGSVGNLVVAAQSPCAGDLVAAADAAILLAKTQCDDISQADDVVASKPAITTEEITN